ncbi:MAG: MoaD/ThiS family protein [Pseudomonadota bacterium]
MPITITVAVADSLTAYLDGRDTAQIEVADGASPHAALDALTIPKDAGYLLLVNEEIVPKAMRDSHALAAGDTLEILPPLKGG